MRRVFLTCIWAIPLWLGPFGPPAFDQTAAGGRAGAATRADDANGPTDELRAEPRLLIATHVQQIRAAHRAGTQPPQDTKLGGGIGIHGWSGKWPGDDRQNLTWGCISLQNPDLEDLHDRVAIGAPVIILP